MSCFIVFFFVFTYESADSGPFAILRDIRNSSFAKLNTRLCFQCLDKSMLVERSNVCDGIIDCPDMTDECLCDGPTPEICNHIQLHQPGVACVTARFNCYRIFRTLMRAKSFNFLKTRKCALMRCAQYMNMVVLSQLEPIVFDLWCYLFNC